VTGIEPGAHRVNIRVTNQFDPEDPDMLASYKLAITLAPVPQVPTGNEKSDLSGE